MDEKSRAENADSGDKNPNPSEAAGASAKQENPDENATADANKSGGKNGGRRNYWRELLREGPDRHIELMLTIAIATFALFQLVITCSNNSSTTQQVNRLISTADRIDDAADSFSGSARHINDGVENAVKKLGQQATNIEAARKTSEDNAKSALDAAIRQANLDERAWVGFVNPFLTLEKSSPLKIGTHVTILGKSPAVQIIVSQGNIFAPVEHELRAEDIKFIPPTIPQGTGFPGSTFPIQETSASSGNQEVSAGIDAVVAKTNVIYYFGRVDYMDIFGKPHWTDFCYVIPSVSINDSHPCAIFNDSDVDQYTKK
jgi:hypothetical protein